MADEIKQETVVAEPAAPAADPADVSKVEQCIKPLSSNGFVAFWQKIARWWLGGWYGFADKHPKLSSIIYKVFFFIVFSEGVTLWQFIIMTFLPFAFAGLGTEAWGWPGVALDFANGAQYIIFGDTNGLGYFVAFEIAVFTAQCINFPLQRNITFKSKGNPYIQALWYFIGWVLISILCNAIWGFANALLTGWDWYNTPGLNVVAGLLKTLLTGTISMVVFFFIFLIIFPDLEKMAKKAEEKNDPKAPELRKRADADTARRNAIAANSVASAKAVSWNASNELLKKMQNDGKSTAEQIATQQGIVDQKFAEALEAANKKAEADAKNAELNPAA